MTNAAPTFFDIYNIDTKQINAKASGLTNATIVRSTIQPLEQLVLVGALIGMSPETQLSAATPSRYDIFC
ncbi:hypothetical protein ACYQR9_20570 [Methylobacterium sp. CM6241]